MYLADVKDEETKGYNACGLVQLLESLLFQILLYLSSVLWFILCPHWQLTAVFQEVDTICKEVIDMSPREAQSP